MPPLESRFPIRPGEQRLTFSLFLHSLFAVGAFLTGRSVRDALFLAHADRSALAWMYVLSALAVTATGLLYARLTVRVRRDRMALASAIVFGLTFIGLYLLERTGQAWVYIVIYVYVEVMGALLLVQFWTLANELFHAREAKRLYGFIGAGGTVANVVVGLAAARLALAFGTDSLLLLCAGLLFGTAAASASAGFVGRERLLARQGAGRAKARQPAGGGGARVLTDDHLRSVAVLAAVTFFTTTLIDFQFKVVAAEHLKGDALAAYFGYFSAAVGVLALGMQLFGTSKLLGRVGVIGSLLVLPVSLAAGDVAMLVIPALWAASLPKGADVLFRYSVNDATTQILYLPAPPQARVSAKAFVDGVVKPGAIGLAGLTLASYRTFLGGDPYRLATISLGLCLVWIAVVSSLRRKYLQSLQDNLRHRRLDLESARHRVIDVNTNAALTRALASSDRTEVLNALQLLPQLEGLDVDAAVARLITGGDDVVRLEALRYATHRQTMHYSSAVLSCFGSPDTAVRSAAIEAFCAIAREKAIKTVAASLGDSSPDVRAAAITGMIRYGGLDGVMTAAQTLKELITHPDPAMRLQAARVLGAVGVKNFYQPLLALMNDSHVGVRRAAIASAGELQAPELTLPLLYRTQTPEAGREALDALTAYGVGLTPTLARVLGNPAESLGIRRAAARLLGRLRTADAVQIITAHLDAPDEELRSVLYRSLARSVRRQRLLLRDVEPVRRAVEAELAGAWKAMHQMYLLNLPDTYVGGNRQLDSARSLLTSALKERVAQVEQRVFLLLAVLHPEAELEQVAAGLKEGSPQDLPLRRANTAELLDNLLDRELKRRFLPLLDESSRADKLAQVEGLYPRPHGSEREVMEALAEDGTAWVRACAVWCLAETGAAAEVMERASLDEHPIVREMALVSLSRKHRSRAAEVALRHLEDAAPLVQSAARAILGPPEPQPAA